MVPGMPTERNEEVVRLEGCLFQKDMTETNISF